MNKIKLIPYIRTFSGDTETPITLFNKYVKDNKGFLLESKDKDGRYSFLCNNPYLEIKAYEQEVTITEEGIQRKESGNVLEIIKSYIGKYNLKNTTDIPFIGGAVGTVGYDIVRQYEYLPNQNMDNVDLPDSHMMFVKELIAYDHFLNKINIIVLEEEGGKSEETAYKKITEIRNSILETTITKEMIPNHEKVSFNSHITEEEFNKAVSRAKEYINDGDIFQVVLSRRWSGKSNIYPFELYRKLRQVNPSKYMFYFNFGSYYVIGSSPEMLVELRKGKIFNCPIAGTRKRGQDDKEDRELEKDLLADEKEKAEHIMLVDLGRNDMGKVSKISSVELASFMKVQKYSHVMHLVSLVQGTKRGDKDMFDVLMAFLPAGTLSGAPKIRAMEIIDELEKEKRGVYGGAVGYFGFDEDMDMCIAIRTMVVKDNKIYLQAGAGIVADSIPENEYEETNNKVKALIAAINS
ncbi:anthranilate synthase component I [Vallitalea longa]|uniref:Anthranilate synthase component 1 n=1 Tax=Vallitalea longa TaxID=2936439 RepID=A0A9W6DG54_9FIRM|nr:anthranilate synthase component I [Vallitalea longa]GKX29389.1 anthranilate synthase component I [Vallitalea longa]